MKSEKSGNLIPMNKRTKEEQREIAKKGGIASGKVRRRKRSMKEAAQIILNLKPPEQFNALLEEYGIDEKDYTNLMLVMAKAAQMAANGNLKAAEFLRDTIGENPKNKLYLKRLEIMEAELDDTSLADEWVAAVKAARKSRNNKIKSKKAAL